MANSSAAGAASAMNPMMGIGAALGAIGGLVNIFQGARMQREARNIKPDYYSINDPRLKGMESQYAKDMLGRAQMQANARIPGAAQRDRQIQTGLAGTQAAVRRGAVDPSMAMQAILASQAQAGQQFDQANMLDAQFQQQREANLVNAQNTMISERDKAFQDRMNKFQMDMSQKNALRNAGQQAISSGISGIAGTFTGIGANQQMQRNAESQNVLLRQMYGIGTTPAVNQATPISLATVGQSAGLTSSMNPVIGGGAISLPNFNRLLRGPMAGFGPMQPAPFNYSSSLQSRFGL